MKNKDNRPGDAVDLRRQAEKIAQRKATHPSDDLEALSPEEARKTLHELRVYQIELEMQNEELCRTREELEISRTKYFDLFDLAPVGYLTLNEKGLIMEVNLTAANLLGVVRSALVKQRLSNFILPDDQDIYYRCRTQLFETGSPQSCELRMMKNDETVFWARLETTVAENADGTPVSRVAMSNITERKRAEETLHTIQGELEDRVIERSRELDQAKSKVKREVTERIFIKESLQKSETLLQKIMEHMPVGVWILDHRGKIISGNRASKQLWGGGRYVDIEHYGEYKGWWIDTGKLIKPHEWGAARAVTKGERSLNEEIEIECFDGTHKFILNSALPLVNDEGNVTGAIVVNQDITELKQAERKRLDDALYARSLIEASLDPLVTISSDGKIMDVNKATENAIGLSREQLIDSDFADYFTEPVMARKGCQEVFSKGFVRDYPLAIRNVSGRVMEVFYNASLYRNESGDVKGILAAARDMTEHIQMEEAIHESETLYHQFFQNSVAGTFRTMYNPSTGDSRRIDCNEAHARILGYDRREDALGIDIKDIFISDHEYENYFHDLLEKKIIRNYRLSLLHKDGKRIWVLLNASARKYDDMIMIEGTMVDISDLVAAEENLKDINEQLGLLTTELIMTEERERRKISLDLHDNIGQTLALTKIKLESLKQPASKDEFTIILDQIEALVNQSIQQARSLMTELSPSILYELGFTEAIEWLIEQMEADYGLQIILNNDLKKRTIDEEVQVLLFRAVRELLLNVVKHAGAGQVFVTLQTAGKNIRITVKDKGTGFDISTIDETIKETGGFGLLSIKERIKHIGGLVEIKSGRGHGTCVTLMAPRKNPKKWRHKK